MTYILDATEDPMWLLFSILVTRIQKQ